MARKGNRIGGKFVENKIKILQQEIKEKEAELKKTREELRKYDKYRHFVFDKYKTYGNGKYRQGLKDEKLYNAIRILALTIFSITDKGSYLSVENLPKTKELNTIQIKFCNDFIDELYPLIEKYTNSVLSEKRKEAK